MGTGDKITGYRYGLDEKGDMWIVTLWAKTETAGRRGERISDNCICERIKNPNTGEEAECKALRGFHGNLITYTKGEKIPGGKVWYFHSEKELTDFYLINDGCKLRETTVGEQINREIEKQGKPMGALNVISLIVGLFRAFMDEKKK